MRLAEPVINATLPSMFMNKVAIITGASRGIGLAIAKKLRSDGASVALCARSIDSLKKHQAEMGEQSLAVAMDIRDQKNVDEGIRRIVDKFGKIDIVVNNAGVSGVTPSRTTTSGRSEAMVYAESMWRMKTSSPEK